jgi:hypothetical protein
MIDIHTDPDDSGHDSKFIFNNLTEHRWRGPILSPGEEADLLRATKGPEPAASAAKNALAQAFQPLVLKEARPYCRADGRNDDIIAAGNFGLAEAIDGFERDHTLFAVRAEPTQYLYRTVVPRKPRGPVAKRLGGAADGSAQRGEAPYIEPKVHTPQPNRWPIPPEYWPSMYPTWGAPPSASKKSILNISMLKQTNLTAALAA